MLDSTLMGGNEFADWLEKKYLDWQYLNGRASIRKFAQWLDIEHSLVSRMMNGKEKPGPKTLPRLADKLGYVVYDVLKLPRPDAGEEELIRQYRAIPPENREAYSAALRAFTLAWAANHDYEIDPDVDPGESRQDIPPESGLNQ